MPRKRTVEPWEEELRAKARELKEERDLDILRTAGIMLIGRRLEEIKQICAAAGLAAPNAPVVLPIPSGQPVPAVPAAPAHACQQCGREAVYRTKPNKFNRTGSWLCRIHLPLKSQFEDAKPAEVAAEAPLSPPPKPDTGSDVTIKDAFAALGVDGSAESV